jgi:hypothetical protein
MIKGHTNGVRAFGDETAEDYDIRDAELRDARGLAEVHVRSWQAAYAGIVPDEDLAKLSVDQREQFWAQILSKGLRATFVLVNRNLVVG